MARGIKITFCLVLGFLLRGPSPAFSYNAQSSAETLSATILPVVDSLDPFSGNRYFSGFDGPYIFKQGNGYQILRVTRKGDRYIFREEKRSEVKNHQFRCSVDNEDNDIFHFKLRKKLKAPKSIYPQPEKMLAISDIEGNFNPLYSLLLNNGVMNKTYQWTYGKGHLVLIGDFMDRGKNVTEVLWLIYHLEQEAEKWGGMVHFILGNHEIMNLQGTTNYVDEKYIQLAKQYSGITEKSTAYARLMGKNQELIQWMKSKNAMEKIGKTLFVHGGISPELLNTRLTIYEINELIRNRLKNAYAPDEYSRVAQDFLFAGLGPLWYRGLAIPYRNLYPKISQEELEKIIRYFKVDHIAIGHTIAKEISAEMEGIILRTDVRHGNIKNSSASQGLLIEKEQYYRVNGKGEKWLLLDENPSSGH